MKVECPKCGALNGFDDAKCWKCRERIPYELRASAKAAAMMGHKEDEEKARRQEEQQEADARRLASIVLTTAYQVAGRTVAREVDIITAECVFGMNIFRDIFVGARDLFGGRSETTQKVLRDARKVVLEELRKEAFSIGADAVIAVDIDYQEMGSGGSTMLMIVASGTAVELEPREIGRSEPSTLAG